MSALLFFRIRVGHGKRGETVLQILHKRRFLFGFDRQKTTVAILQQQKARHTESGGDGATRLNIGQRDGRALGKPTARNRERVVAENIFGMEYALYHQHIEHHKEKSCNDPLDPKQIDGQQSKEDNAALGPQSKSMMKRSVHICKATRGVGSIHYIMCKNTKLIATKGLLAS